MIHDPIVGEIRESRHRHAKSLGFDLKKIFNDLKSRQEKSGKRVVSRSPRKYLKATGT